MSQATIAAGWTQQSFAESTQTAWAFCGSQQRVLTGGAHATDAVTSVALYGSQPVHATEWQATASISADVQLEAVAICVPAQTPTVSITSGPPAAASSQSATFSFTGSDPLGEPLTYRCQIDSSDVAPCTPDTPLTYTGIAEGSHVFTVVGTNAAYQGVEDARRWSVDVTAPTVVAKAPTSSLAVTGPATATFSEIVEGVGATTMYVRADGTSADIPGTVTTTGSDAHTMATWRPSSPLVPGRWYTVYLTSAIHDHVGNALPVTSWRVRAVTTVENTSPSLTERWDVDVTTLASGGRAIASSTVGSAARLGFSATAGQQLGLYVLRLPAGGNAEVWLDGVRKATVSCYAATGARARVYLSGGLTAGKHTLEVRVLGTRPTGSSGTVVSLDAVTVGTTTYQESVLVQSFRRIGATAASGASYDTIDHATDAGGRPYYTLRFWGTGIKWYATRSTSGGHGQVYVDGTLAATVSLAAASTTYRSLVFSKALAGAAAQHTVMIVAAGSASGAKSALSLDYLLVT
jgi:hypothetical protein